MLRTEADFNTVSFSRTKHEISSEEVAEMTRVFLENGGKIDQLPSCQFTDTSKKRYGATDETKRQLSIGAIRNRMGAL